MSHLKLLALKITLVEFIRLHFNGNLFNNTEPVSFKPDHFFGIIGHEPHLSNPEINQNTRLDIGMKLKLPAK